MDAGEERKEGADREMAPGEQGTGRECSIDCNPALVVWTTGMSSPGNVRNLIRERIVQYQQASRRGWYGSALFSRSPGRLRETWYYCVPVSKLFLVASAEDGMRNIKYDWEPEEKNWTQNRRGEINGSF